MPLNLVDFVTYMHSRRYTIDYIGQIRAKLIIAEKAGITEEDMLTYPPEILIKRIYPETPSRSVRKAHIAAQNRYLDFLKEQAA